MCGCGTFFSNNKVEYGLFIHTYIKFLYKYISIKWPIPKRNNVTIFLGSKTSVIYSRLLFYEHLILTVDT
jgi:hypothetical protein